MGGWHDFGRIVSKGFEKQIVDPITADEEYYPLEEPVIICHGVYSGSTQVWGDYIKEDLIVKRTNEILKIRRDITAKRWIEFDGQEFLLDEEDIPLNAKLLKKPIVGTSKFSITVYNLNTKTQSKYEVRCTDENIPFDVRNIKTYLNEKDLKKFEKELEYPKSTVANEAKQE